jgi:hypothetical protein
MSQTLHVLEANGLGGLVDCGLHFDVVSQVVDGGREAFELKDRLRAVAWFQPVKTVTIPF